MVKVNSRKTPSARAAAVRAAICMKTPWPSSTRSDYAHGLIYMDVISLVAPSFRSMQPIVDYLPASWPETPRDVFKSGRLLGRRRAGGRCGTHRATWTVLQQDGPDHLGLLYMLLPVHQTAPLTSGCDATRSHEHGTALLNTSRVVVRPSSGGAGLDAAVLALQLAAGARPRAGACELFGRC